MVIEANVKRMDTEKELEQAQAQVLMWIGNLYVTLVYMYSYAHIG